MATKTQVIVTMTDDLDGTEGAETIQFGWAGVNYEIDLNDKNRAKIEKALQPYLEAGRRLSRSGKPFRRTQVGPDMKTVRAWARANDIDVPATGRLPQAVIDKFEAAQSASSNRR